MKNIRSDLKIIIVGNANTGKTSFVNKWTKNQFHEHYKATIVSEFGYKIYQYKNNIYRIQVWDLAGQDKNTTMTKVFCKDSHGVIILSDITAPSTLEATATWKNIIDDSVTFFDGSALPMMLLQNKIDLVDPSDLKTEQVNEFAMRNGFNMCYQASVKEAKNINESMNDFLQYVIEKTEGLKQKDIEERERKSIIIEKNDNKAFQNKKNCCG